MMLFEKMGSILDGSVQKLIVSPLTISKKSVKVSNSLRDYCLGLFCSFSNYVVLISLPSYYFLVFSSRHLDNF